MPKIVDHKQHQKKLAEAALKTVASAGVAGTTMRSVADAAGCSTGTLVHYFANRDELLIAALRCAHDRTGERMRAVVSDSKARNLLHRFIAEALPLDRERREEWRIWLAFWGSASIDKPLAVEHRSRYREWVPAIAEVMRIGIERAEIDPRIEPTREAEALAAFIDGLGIQATLDPRRLPRRRQLELIHDYLARLVVSA